MLNFERFDISAKANFRSNVMDTNFDKKIFIKKYFYYINFKAFNTPVLKAFFY